MDLEILKKKISTFRGEGGRVRNVSDELLYEILLAWENWSGPMKDFYTSIGVSKNGMASIIGKAKKMKREGHFPSEEFKEVKLEPALTDVDSCGLPIRIKWETGRVIQFSQVDQLVDFLKKVA